MDVIRDTQDETPNDIENNVRLHRKARAIAAAQNHVSGINNRIVSIHCRLFPKTLSVYGHFVFYIGSYKMLTLCSVYIYILDISHA